MAQICYIYPEDCVARQNKCAIARR